MLLLLAQKLARLGQVPGDLGERIRVGKDDGIILRVIGRDTVEKGLGQRLGGDPAVGEFLDRDRPAGQRRARP